MNLRTTRLPTTAAVIKCSLSEHQRQIRFHSQPRRCSLGKPSFRSRYSSRKIILRMPGFIQPGKLCPTNSFGSNLFDSTKRDGFTIFHQRDLNRDLRTDIERLFLHLSTALSLPLHQNISLLLQDLPLPPLLLHLRLPHLCQTLLPAVPPDRKSNVDIYDAKQIFQQFCQLAQGDLPDRSQTKDGEE